MNEPASVSSVRELSTKIDGMVLGLKWMVSLLIVLLSIPNLFAACSIGHFDLIFRDALPGKPLPGLTVLLINGSSFFIFLSLFWPVVGVLSVFFGRQPRSWIIGAACIEFLIGLQITLTWIGCFTPMFGLIQGIPN
jgi:hypothetical protein